MDFLKDVNGSATLWRYMDLSKFLDLLLHKHLIFPRYDMFEDTYEGYASNFSELIRKDLGTFPEINQKVTDDIVDFLSKVVSVFNYHSYVSCWHLNEFESAGMWKLYCNSPEALVIKTNVNKLKEALSPAENQKIVYSKVTYKSKLDDEVLENIRSVHPNSALLLKRESFDHEKEYRVLLSDENLRPQREGICNKYHDYEFMSIGDWCETIKNDVPHNIDTLMEKYNEQNNIEKEKFFIKELDQLKKNNPIIETVEINPEILIEEIIVSPHAPKWFLKTLQKLIEDLGCGFKVSQSKLYELS